MSFSADRLACLDKERDELSKAIDRAARRFEQLTRPDIEAEETHGFGPHDPGAPWAPYRSNRTYAFYGSFSRGEQSITYYEDRFSDEFTFPVAFLTDPESWTTDYRKRCEAYKAAQARQARKDKREERQRTETYERAQLARLQAKYATPTTEQEETS
jgi:hypothetical protein